MTCRQNICLSRKYETFPLRIIAFCKKHPQSGSRAVHYPGIGLHDSLAVL